MRYSKINDVPVEKVLYEDIHKFFVEYAFFMFMEKGRKGLEQAAVDAIDNFSVQIRATGWNQKATTFQWENIPKGDSEKLAKRGTTYLVDGFIREGSKGLESGMQYIHTMMANYMSGSKLQ